MPEPILTVQQLAQAMASAAPPYVLDVREETEWLQSHISHPAVRHLPLSSLENHLDDLPRDQPIAVLCRSGARSARLTAFLNALGYTATNVQGGMLEWVAQVDPALPQP